MARTTDAEKATAPRWAVEVAQLWPPQGEWTETDYFAAQCCFLCQQAAEKATKALHYCGGARFVIGHSVTQLLRDLIGMYPHLEELLDMARELDQYYIPTRYPNGLPAGAPCEIYTRAQAETALHGADRLLTKVQAVLEAGEGDDVAVA